MKRLIRRFVGGEAGQVLPLAALMLVALIAIVGLAIDVSGAFMEQRWQRSITDGAALAGGQDLQMPGRLLPGSAARDSARRTALTVVAAQLGATSFPPPVIDPNCLIAVGCPLPGTPYRVSVYAGVDGALPRPTCLDCVPERAVQVNLSQPTFGLTFSRILGFSNWDVRASSVAGVVFARQYGVVTLRPPDPRAHFDANEDDIFITGGSKVFVGDGDVVSNSNVVCSGTNSEVNLEVIKGFAIYHYDPYEAWDDCLNPPSGVQVTSPVADPGYSIPKRTDYDPITSPIATYTTEADALDPDPANCLAQQQLVSAEYLELDTNLPINDPDQVIVKCMRPGIYTFTLDVKDNASGPPVAYLLEPGVYFFDAGVRVQSTLIGGYEPGAPGVALVFLEAGRTNGSPPGQLSTTNPTSLLALNFGDAYCPLTTCPLGELADPATGPLGPVATPAPQSVLLSLMVEPDTTHDCLPITELEDRDCRLSANDRNTLVLTGGGNIFLAGVQYAPTDRVELKGNAGQAAEVGAVWAWTLKFDGGTLYRIRTANPELLGVLRLDRGCSPGNTCTP